VVAADLEQREGADGRDDAHRGLDGYGGCDGASSWTPVRGVAGSLNVPNVPSPTTDAHAPRMPIDCRIFRPVVGALTGYPYAAAPPTLLVVPPARRGS
jgi:hypothetical protein